MSASAAAVLQILILVVALTAAVPFLGHYLAHLYTSPRHLAVERWAYRVMRVDADADQHWRSYATSLLGFSMVGIVLLYACARLQEYLPLSLGFAGFPADGAWNSAVSFTTNTNWQWYSGESAAGYLLQVTGLMVEMFVSGAVGMAVAAALARGLSRTHASGRVGNFWADVVRAIVRVAIPFSVVASLVLCGCGVIENLRSYYSVTTISGGHQTITGGLVAFQESIKDLFNNGGGWFNANSSHPFENPTPFTDLFEIFLMLVVPFAMAWAFGLIVKDRRQGGAILATMASLWLASVSFLTWSEMSGAGRAAHLAGAAMEGKETRFGEAASALFAASTTLTSTGSVNAMHDSLTAQGGGIAMFDMMLGEIAPGGAGSGLYGMLMLAVVTVFLCGLMVGRTPEYLGKRIGRPEIVLVALYILATPVLVLVGAAIALTASGGLAGLEASGPHGLSEALYAVTSAANNNGSAFAGLTAGTPFWDTLLGVLMLFGRYLPMVLVLALAGRFAVVGHQQAGAGTLPTHRPLFITLLLGVAVVVVGLTYVPALALGPIVESLA